MEHSHERSSQHFPLPPLCSSRKCHHNGFHLGQEVRNEEAPGDVKEVRVWSQEELRHTSSEWLDQGLMVGTKERVHLNAKSSFFSFV